MQNGSTYESLRQEIKNEKINLYQKANMYENWQHRKQCEQVKFQEFSV